MKNKIFLLLFLGLSNIAVAQTVTELYEQGNWIKNHNTEVEQSNDTSATSMANTLNEQNKNSQSNNNGNNQGRQRESIRSRYIKERNPQHNRPNDLNSQHVFYTRENNVNGQYR